MTCYHPWTAYRTETDEIVFSEVGARTVETVTLPCGWCTGCRLDKAQSWAIRCDHEAKTHGPENCCFANLTFDQEHLPPDGSVRKSDLQAFFKRLRMRLRRMGLPAVLRYFGVGEYGENLGRPHYHALLFGYRPWEGVRWGRADARGNQLWHSPWLTETWGLGRVLYGDVSPQSAGYCARYALKKVYGDAAERHYSFLNPETGEVVRRNPEFALMSTRPAIGKRWAERFESDFFPEGQCIVRGKNVSLPRYYVRKWAERNPEAAEDFKAKRAQKARERYPDNTDARLLVKEEVKVARLRSLVRPLEGS